MACPSSRPEPFAGRQHDPPPLVATTIAKLHPNAAVLYVRLAKCYDSTKDAVSRQKELHHIHTHVSTLVDSLTSRALWKFNCGGGDFILAAGVTADGKEQDAGPGCQTLESVAATLLARIDSKHDLRMALHAGPVSSGIIGSKPLQFG